VVISVSGVTSLFSSDYEIELVQFDLFDAVRLGLTAMPNVAAGANGGLPLGDANGRVGLQAGTSAGQLDFTSGVVKANLAQILGTALTETAGQIAAAFKQFFDVASPTGTMKYISRVALVDTTTTNTDMRGTDNAATAAEMAKVPKSDSNVSFNATALAAIAAKVEASILDEGDATALLAAIAAKVEEFLINEGDATATIAAIATACNAAIAAGTVGSNVTAIKAKTDNLPSDPADQSAVEAAIAAAKFDPETALVETGVTYKQALQRIGATTAGKASGAGSGTETFKGLDGTTDRVEATVDNDGNRTGVTYDP
jgi:hypothetical protein